MSMKSVLISLLMLLGFASQNALALQQPETLSEISKCLTDDQEHAAVIPVSEPDSGDDYPVHTPTALALAPAAREHYPSDSADVLSRNDGSSSIRAPPLV